MPQKSKRGLVDGILEILENPSHPSYREFIAIGEGMKPGDFEAAHALLTKFDATRGSFADWHEYIKNNPPSSLVIGFLILHAVDAYKSKRGKIAANALHSKTGGSRENAQRIRQLWASGKYSSRDICAEQESAALGISFAAARKALRNTPDPT